MNQKDREAMQMALDSLELALTSHGKLLLSDPPQDAWKIYGVENKSRNTIAAQRERLSQPEPEPVAWMNEKAGGYRYYSWQKQYPNDTPLYTAPPKREWVGLTDEEIQTVVNKVASGEYQYSDTFARAIEAKLKEKNT